MSNSSVQSAYPGRVKGPVSGALLTLAFAGIAFATWWFLQGTWLKLNALLWAFVYSVIATNIMPGLTNERFKAGIQFSSTSLLRLAIACLGLTVSASVWFKLGGVGLAAVLINLAFAFAMGTLLCRYVLKMDGALSLLIGVGTCICGASAIAATGPAIKAKSEEMAVSLAAVTLFGLLAMFGYPLLFQGPLSGWLQGNHLAYGIWSGMGIHETAQVVAAASQVSGAVGIAMSAKSIRIFMIGPMVFASLFLFRRFLNKTGGANTVKLSIPWFAVVFVMLTLLNAGIERLPFAKEWASFDGSYVKPVVTFLLAWAFAGVGFQGKASAIRSIGVKTFIGGIVVALIAGGSALLLTKYLWLPFAS